MARPLEVVEREAKTVSECQPWGSCGLSERSLWWGSLIGALVDPSPAQPSPACKCVSFPERPKMSYLSPALGAWEKHPWLASNSQGAGHRPKPCTPPQHSAEFSGINERLHTSTLRYSTCSESTTVKPYAHASHTRLAH